MTTGLEQWLLREYTSRHSRLRERDPFATVEQYLVWCPTCDGSGGTRRVWRPGDALYVCNGRLTFRQVFGYDLEYENVEMT